MDLSWRRICINASSLLMVQMFSVFTTLESSLLSPVSIPSIRDGSHGVSGILCVTLKQVSATEGKGKRR